MTSDAVIWLLLQEHIVAQCPVRQMPRKWPHKLNLLLPLSTRSLEGMGFDVILLILVLELKGHKEGKKRPKHKWFNSDMKKSFIFVFIFTLPADLGFFGFKKYLSTWFLRNIHNTYVSWNAIKTTQLPERPVTYQMVKSPQDQADASEARNFRQYKSSGSSHPSKAVETSFSSLQHRNG